MINFQFLKVCPSTNESSETKIEDSFNAGNLIFKYQTRFSVADFSLIWIFHAVFHSVNAASEATSEFFKIQICQTHYNPNSN